MSFAPPYAYIDAETLAKELRERAANPGKIAVVDVRGHIVGAIHSPSATFLDKVGALATDLLKDYDQVVFHCSLSQQRGPKAARIYRETRENLQANKRLPEGPQKQEIFVLRDGFANFGAMFKKDRALVQDWDESAWQFR